MPGMTGIELVAKLRQRQIHITALLIASRVNEEFKGRATRSGFLRGLEKPLYASGLLDRIHAALA